MTREERLENLLEMSDANVYACMKCGKCSGRCPANVQPHRFVSLLARGRVEELLNSEVERVSVYFDGIYIYLK